MKALIFAAGLGERMRPLTDTTPKPLLKAGDKPLIVWHLEKLAKLSVTDVVINTSWLAEQFPNALGDGAHWGLRLTYSYEGQTPLETGGGMLNALPLLGDAPFIAINGDIWADYDFALLPREPSGDAHLVLVDNPAQHPRGDFVLRPDGTLTSNDNPRLTFSGIGVYRPQILHEWRSTIGDLPGTRDAVPRFKLAPLLHAAIDKSLVTGTHYSGPWTDVGTPKRLTALNDALALQEKPG